tara:strand:+ start:120 stop:548 length:429 start_codon:yes stop_codon:yes gene_type:complete
MSTRNLISETKPIPINYTKSCYSFSDPSGPKKNYLFSLDLTLKNGSLRRFNKLESSKYSYIVDIDDEVNYTDITRFNVNVTELPTTENTYSMNGLICHDSSTFTQKDENFYIEFSQNNNGNAICTCYFIGVDFNTMFISPPN